MKAVTLVKLLLDGAMCILYALLMLGEDTGPGKIRSHLWRSGLRCVLWVR